MKIKRSERLAYSPAFTVVITAFAELVKLGHHLPKFEFSNQSKVVYLTNDDETEILGFNVYGIKDGEGALFFVWIHPDHRGNGYYDVIMDECIKHLKELGAVAILSGVIGTNTNMMECVKHMELPICGVKIARLMGTQQIPPNW